MSQISLNDTAIISNITNDTTKINELFDSLLIKILFICGMIVVICALIFGMILLIYCLIRNRRQSQNDLGGQTALGKMMELDRLKNNTGKKFEFKSLQNTSQLGTDSPNINKANLSLSELRVKTTPINFDIKNTNVMKGNIDNDNNLQEDKNSSRSSGSRKSKKKKQNLNNSNNSNEDNTNDIQIDDININVNMGDDMDKNGVINKKAQRKLEKKLEKELKKEIGKYIQNSEA